MKRIYFVTSLLFLLMFCATAQAQERGDGTGTSTNNDPNGIITGRTGSSSGGGIVKGTNPWFDKNMMAQRIQDDGVLPFTPGTSEFGAKLGFNFQQMAHSPFTHAFNPGLIGGLYYRRYWRITAIKIEALGSSAHYVSTQAAGAYAVHPSDSVTKSYFKTIYLSVPVLGQLQVYHNINIELGPQYSYLITYADKNGVFTKIYGQNDIFKRNEFSGVIGIDARVADRFRVDLRYVKGLTDVNNSVYPEAYLQWNINSLQATVSYRLY